jgi:predicted aminopeptidase
MSISQEESLAFIKSVRDFGEKELGLNFYESFQSVSEKTDYAYWLFASLPYKIESAFSKKRPYRFFWSKQKALVSEEEYRRVGFDTFVCKGEASGNPRCPILPSLLNASRARQVEVVLHEGWHMTLANDHVLQKDRSLNEAGAIVVGEEGALLFARIRGDEELEKEILDTIDWWGRLSTLAWWAVNELETAYALATATNKFVVREAVLKRVAEAVVASGLIDHKSFSEDGELNNAFWLRERAYVIHSRLFRVAHEALGGDVKKTISFLLALPKSQSDALGMLKEVCGERK